MGSNQPLPQARTEKLVVQTLADETLVYDLASHQAHCLNRTATAVWEHCDGRTTVADMAARLGQDLNAPAEEDVVRLALDQLESVHLLQAWTPTRTEGRLVSRRQLVRQLGLGAALAIPAITSIIAPEAAQAASCQPNGSGSFCTSNAQCCSGCCKNDGSNKCVGTGSSCMPA